MIFVGMLGSVLSFLPSSGIFGGTASAAPTDLIISEYIEGSSNNKALELYNGTGQSIDLGADRYVLRMYFNGSTLPNSFPLTGTIAAGGVFVVAPTNANATILATANQQTGSAWFNGDDAVVITKGLANTVVDSLGQVGVDPGTEWGTGLTSTADNTLRKKADVCVGDTNTGDAFDPSVAWDGFATDTFADLVLIPLTAVIQRPTRVGSVRRHRHQYSLASNHY